ncbi:signal peptidase I [Mycoplasmatota bacterium]|nr:signal peptidase I [Mycoplasmatota bacterium]
MLENNEKEIDTFKIVDTTEKAEVEIDDNESNNENKNPKKDNVFKELLNYVILIAVAFGLAQVIHRYIFTPVTVVGPSMMTKIHDDDRIFLSRLGKIERFDVVVFNVPTSKDPYIKRVIGLPGDDVKMVDYKLYINGNLVEEPYLNPDPIYTGIDHAYSEHVSFTLETICRITNTNCNVDGHIEIPKGYYLVLGDNRNNSTDSRMIGLISEDRVIGKAKFIFYPFNRFGKTFE